MLVAMLSAGNDDFNLAATRALDHLSRNKENKAVIVPLLGAMSGGTDNGNAAAKEALRIISIETPSPPQPPAASHVAA